MAESNRTEKATSKKHQDERKKGNAFQSKDLVSVCMIIISFVLISKLTIFASHMVGKFYLGQIGRMQSLYELTISGAMSMFGDALITFAFAALPILVILAFIAFAAAGVQTGFLFFSRPVEIQIQQDQLFAGSKKDVFPQLGRTAFEIHHQSCRDHVSYL